MERHGTITMPSSQHGGSQHARGRPWRGGAVRRGLTMTAAMAGVITLVGTSALAATAAMETGATTSAVAGAQSRAVQAQAQTQPATPPDAGSDSPFSGLQPDSDPGENGVQSVEATAIDSEPATEAQSAGVVIIETVLGYQESEAAGTGIVLTSDGLVVTNDHVIEGSTSITVTVAATGETYGATVLGTDSSSDIAVLQLDGATGLETVTIDDDDDLALGDEVIAVGNALGAGELTAAYGTVTDLDATITAASQGVATTLDGLIEIDADVVSGDSGGPLLDDEGEVIGITTAASSGTSDITGYAVDIDDALVVVEYVVAGVETDTNTIGFPAFLGVALRSTAPSSAATPGAATGPGPRGARQQASTTDSGGAATIAGVYDGTPAAEAGLEAGDTIIAIDAVEVADGDTLAAILAGYAPGDEVTITWTDDSGTIESATVTLIEGPAD